MKLSLFLRFQLFEEYNERPKKDRRRYKYLSESKQQHLLWNGHVLIQLSLEMGNVVRKRFTPLYIWTSSFSSTRWSGLSRFLYPSISPYVSNILGNFNFSMAPLSPRIHIYNIFKCNKEPAFTSTPYL